MPAALTLTESGTLTLAPELIAHIGAKAGDPISIEKLPNRSLKVEASKDRPKVMDFAGCFKTDLRLSLEEIEEATARGFLKEKTREPLSRRETVR